MFLAPAVLIGLLAGLLLGGRISRLAELRRRCWTQFDARVVAALERHLASTGELEMTAKAS